MLKKEIQNRFTWLVNEVSQTVIYNWSDSLKRDANKQTFNYFYKELEKYIDFKNITVEEAKELRFGKWSDEQPDLWLFPLYLVPIIPEGLEIEYIDGTKGIYEKDKMDNDTRFGCVAYGINIKE